MEKIIEKKESPSYSLRQEVAIPIPGVNYSNARVELKIEGIKTEDNLREQAKNMPPMITEFMDDLLSEVLEFIK